MRTVACLLVLSAAFAAAAENDKVEAKKDLERMQGAWAVTAVEEDGKPLGGELIKGWKLTITGDRYVFEPGKERIEGVYELDPAHKPKHINATRTSGDARGKVLQGIYQIDGDEMKMCYQVPGAAKRPAAFATRASDGVRLYVFRRIKP
jgi:uncharacterized protein (TIGR03067 family)